MSVLSSYTVGLYAGMLHAQSAPPCAYASHNKKYHEAAMRLYVKLKLYLNDVYYVKRLPHLTCIKRLLCQSLTTMVYGRA